MKTLNLQAAIAGAPIQYGNGEKITFVAFVPEAGFNDRFVYMDKDGYVRSISEHTACIFMAPVVRTHWANVHRTDSGSIMVGVSMPDEKAVQLARNFLPDYIKTISFEVED